MCGALSCGRLGYDDADIDPDGANATGDSGRTRTDAGAQAASTSVGGAAGRSDDAGPGDVAVTVDANGGNGGFGGGSGSTGTTSSGTGGRTDASMSPATSGPGGGSGSGGSGSGGVAAGAGTGGTSGTGGSGGTGGTSGTGGSRGGKGGASTTGTTSGTGGAGGSGGVIGTGGAGGGGDSGASLCSSGSCKRVFITSTPVPMPLGGAGAADTKCQTLADARSLGGTWKAWISDAAGSAAARLTHANVPYSMLDGTVIANDWKDLTDGALAHSIDVDETATKLTGPAEAWTGTNTNGAAIFGLSCADWTNSTRSLPYGYVGVSDHADYGWTLIFEQFCDRTDPRLYCFEQ